MGFLEKFKAVRKLSGGVFLATLAVALLLSLSTLGLLTVNQTIISTGTVTTVNVGVFSDSSCTQPLTSLSWGSISSGASVSRTIYVKNTGNAPITISMSTNSWVPASVSTYLTVTWNKEGASLAVNQVTSADLTLTVSPSINGITGFTVNIVITGTG